MCYIPLECRAWVGKGVHATSAPSILALWPQGHSEHLGYHKGKQMMTKLLGVRMWAIERETHE